MGRRSTGQFERRPQDKYYTPYEAVVPLLPHLPPQTVFVEPCAGDGRLVRHLERHGHICADAFDVEPEHETVRQGDALEMLNFSADAAISNPPWTRPLLHDMIDHWRVQMPTWFLFDAEWMHTKQSVPYMRCCQRIVSIGRVKWIEGSKMTGKDSCAWYLFGRREAVPVFYGRRA